MEIVGLLRELSRHRVLVSLVLVVSIIAGVSVSYRLGLPPQSRHYEVGVASASALVDTPSSQVVDLGDGKTNPGALPGRAALLANLLTTAPLRQQIAKEAGVPATRLLALAPLPGALANGSPGAIGDSDVKASDPRANIVTLYTDTTLPIITVSAQAPDPQVAARLANSAIKVLQAHVESVAGSDAVPQDRRLVVSQLNPATFGMASRGPRRAFSIVASLLLFGLGCAGILGFSALRRGWREADERERDDSGTGSGPAVDAFDVTEPVESPAADEPDDGELPRRRLLRAVKRDAA